MPFDDAEEAQVILAAPAAQLVAAQPSPLGKFQRGAPQLQQGEEIAVFIPPLGVCLVGLRGKIGGTLPRVHDGESCHHDQELRQCLLVFRLQQHAPQPRVKRQPRQTAAYIGELFRAVQCADFAQGLVTLIHQTWAGRIRQGELAQRRQPQISHAEDDPGECAALDFRVGERLAVLKVRLRIQADAHTLRHAPAASRALAGTGL